MQDRPAFLWLGNHAAADLVNTELRIDGTIVDLLETGDDLHSWSRHAGLRGSPGAAAQSLDFVRRLRRALRAALDRAAPEADGIETLNKVLGEAVGALQVGPSGAADLGSDDPATQLRLDIAATAVDIFSYDPARVRRCASSACVLLFLDTSKGGRRRWCDMRTCGNRAKSAAHHRRVRRSGQSPGPEA